MAKAAMSDQQGDINQDLDSGYRRNRTVLGAKDPVKPAWESKEKLKEYQKQHRIERMQSFLKQCQVSRRRPLTSRRPQPQPSQQDSIIASHKGHTPSQALRHVESSYNISSGS